jgi:ABC-type branched-subunit amino acid transport system ATPase component
MSVIHSAFGTTLDAKPGCASPHVRRLRASVLPGAQIPWSPVSVMEIAMALATRPRLLLLDEPMAGMGPEESARLVDTLRELKGSITILLIEHDMDVVFALADRISVLVYGRIIASGDGAAIRADPAVRQAYLGDGEGAAHG